MGLQFVELSLCTILIKKVGNDYTFIQSIVKKFLIRGFF